MNKEKGVKIKMHWEKEGILKKIATNFDNLNTESDYSYNFIWKFRKYQKTCDLSMTLFVGWFL